MVITRVEWKTEKGFDKLVNEHWGAWIKERMGSDWKRMLDLGGGTGAISAKFASTDRLIVCMDLSEKNIQRGREMHRVVPNFYYVVGDAHNLPFKDGAFDVVHSWAALHHFPDKNRAMGEVKRTLRDGGKLLAIEPGLVNPFTAPARKFFSTTRHDAFEKPFVPSDLVKMISMFFRKVESKSFGFLTYIIPFALARLGKISKIVKPLSPHLVKLDDGLSKIFNEFAGTVAICAEK